MSALSAGRVARFMAGTEETAEELVERCYRRVLERRGVTKGAGGAVIDHFELAAEVIAEVGVICRDQLRKNEKALKRNGRKIAALAAAHGVTVRPVPEIHQGMVDLDLQRFGVGLVDRQAAPKVMNGHGSSRVTEAGPSSVPLWHPETDS